MVCDIVLSLAMEHTSFFGPVHEIELRFFHHHLSKATFAAPTSLQARQSHFSSPTIDYTTIMEPVEILAIVGAIGVSALSLKVSSRKMNALCSNVKQWSSIIS